ncbi:hypothetical protein [Paenibacillus faecalis]|uniref:hypothetical protein n=1 Tax=Paenibacillus faecalis TaxID=2079532 RepID=UPI00131A4FA4|nr:hypothetical protein [Paenibacillus faecalis]
MNDKKAWTWSVLCLATFIALTTAAYIMIPDGNTGPGTLPESPYYMSADNDE